MPTAKDITTFRKAGQLTEAFDLATELLSAEPDNIWIKRAMGWVRYERLKVVAKNGSPDAFLAEWSALSALVANNPADETMLTNQAIWQAVSHLFALSESGKVAEVLNTVFASVQQWPVVRPSDLYSALLKAFLKAGKTWAGLGNFLTWWQLGNLRSEDYLSSLTNEGKKLMSLAEQAYIAYAKHVLLHPTPETIRALIADLEVLHTQHPEYQYPPYYQAKLLVATGSKEEAMTALLPFARRRQSEFWLWDLLAELYDDEPEKAIACLCRAVSCRSEEKFLVKARVNLARKLNAAGQLNEALTELTLAIKARQAEGWRVAENLTAGVDKLTKKRANLLADNKPLYRRYYPMTEDLLYGDMPEQIGVITFLNTEKKVAHFMVNKAITGHFNYDRIMARAQPGDAVALRLEERMGKDGKFWIPLSIKPTSQV
ncbi:MAG: hypothetical protein LH609_02370, partial [Rudanella sp.]|nr:hypothetical protein [Rudanella sp.]